MILLTRGNPVRAEQVRAMENGREAATEKGQAGQQYLYVLGSETNPSI